MADVGVILNACLVGKLHNSYLIDKINTKKNVKAELIKAELI